MNDKNNHLTTNQIQAILDQNLEIQESRYSQEHLESCTVCQEEVERQKSMITRLEKLPEISLNKDLSVEILSQIREQKHSLSGVTWTLVVEALAAGAVIGALIPVFQATSWLPGLIHTRQQALAAVNIFLTQLASTWIVWWAQLQLDLKGFINPLLTYTGLPSVLPSPWILIAAAGGIGILINYFLLRNNPIENHNHQS